MDPLTSSLSTCGIEERSDAELSLFNLVFRNDLIGNKISSYLNFADMKDVSASCRTLYGMVRNSQNFNQTAKLCLHTQNWGRSLDLGTEKEDPASSSETARLDAFVGFGVIQVDLAMSGNIMKILQGNSNFLNKIHTLSIVGDSEDVITEAVAMLHYIFTNTSLVTLQINREVATGLNLGDHFNPQTEYFTKLRNLEFVSKVRNFWHSPTFEGNVNYFSTLPLKLQSLKIEKAGFYENIADLILANAGTIQDLVLDSKENYLWEITKFGNICLPLLKRLSASLSDREPEIENFIVFMKNQPLLEELSLCVRKKCGETLLSLIQERGSKLKKLRLEANRFGNGKNLVNWGFLADMKNLQDFALVREKFNGRITVRLQTYSPGTGVSFLRVLPISLKHLKLGGIMNFWLDSDQNTEIGGLERQSLFNRFPNLATLSLVHNGGQGLNEDFLERVSIACPKLQKLELSSIGGSVDGPLNASVVVNLANLKGLTDITLKGWGSIAELMGSMSHPFLRNFATDEKGFTERDTNFAIQFVKRNPSLEKISISGNDFNIPNLVDALNANSSRLCHIDWSSATADSDSDSSVSIGDGEDDSDNDTDEYSDYDNWENYDNDYDEVSDYTACDQECGYCGRCDY